jgi:hypothetical protein
VIGKGYAKPIVDHIIALREARARFTDFKRLHPDFYEQAKALNIKHGSRRKRKAKKTKVNVKAETETNQLSLF